MRYFRRRAAAGGFAAAAFVLTLALTGCDDAQQPAATPAAEPMALNRGHLDDHSFGQLEHVVVIYLENRSFDNLYGGFPGANGLRWRDWHRFPQVDSSGHPFQFLPQVAGSPFPTDLPNAPFPIEQYLAANVPTIDLVHRFYQEQAQIDGGRMDRFAAVSDAKGLVMGFYNTDNLPLAAEARRYTLCDNFFHAAFGGSFLNHFWLIAARTPVFPNAPASVVAQLDAQGHLVKDGFVTPDGYAVNTAFTVNTPHPATVPAANLVPNQTFPTIGDRLSDKGISWVWYSGGWNNAVAGHPDPLFQFHHQAFAFFANYADGTPGRAEHLKDEVDFVQAVEQGNLPAVSFVKPYGLDNEHPGYTDLITGEQHVLGLINAIRASRDWAHTAIIITYDENGGFWDHVAPRVVDRWGPGARVPTLVISPLARQGYVDHRRYDTTSILALIERRWHLDPLTTRDAAADPLSGAFDFHDEKEGQR
jgi:phospholipase C